MKIYPLKQVREREYDPRVEEFATKRSDKATDRLRKHEHKLNNLIELGMRDAHTIDQKWDVMDAIMQIVAEAVAPLAPCRAGCDACCHHVVPLSQLEAERIAQHTGLPMASPPLHPNPTFEGSAPCPFLKKGRCTIYPVRPLSCRWHFNMDSTDMLCSDAADGKPVRVLYWNRVAFEKVAAQIFGPGIRLDSADIRSFFPKGQ